MKRGSGARAGMALFFLLSACGLSKRTDPIGAVPGQCLTEPADLDGSVFEVTVPEGIAQDLELLFRFEVTDGGLFLFVGSLGQMRTGALVANGSRFELSEPFEMVGRDGTDGITLTWLDVCVKEDSVTGSAEYTVTNTWEGVVTSTDHTELVAGKPDTHAPLWHDDGEMHPLIKARLRTSEALMPGATAKIAGRNSQPLEPVIESEAVVAFSPPNVLPLGLEGSIERTGTDYAEHPVDQGFIIVVRTPSDPGIQPEDGFESTLNAAVFYGPPTVDVVGAEEALEGAASALIPGGTTAIFQLARAPGTERVLFDLKPRIQLLDAPAEIILRIGVVGGTQVTTESILLDPEALDETVRSIELVLDDDGDTVLLSIKAPFVPNTAVAAADAIIDRLRVE